MISLLFATLAAAVAEPTAGPSADNEIVVIGNSLRNWRGSWELRKNAVICKTRRLTGDKAIDSIGCNSLTRCITPLVPDLGALARAKLSKSESQNKVNDLFQNAAVGECIYRHREDGIATLTAERRSKRK